MTHLGVRRPLTFGPVRTSADGLRLQGAILISDLERDGSEQLLGVLSSRIETVVQPAVWVDDLRAASASTFDSRRFTARHLRGPLKGEIGTALAHRGAYETILAGPEGWWLVFEDDARILDLDQLLDRVSEVIATVPDREACVVNLSHRAARKPFFHRDIPIPGIWHPICPTYTATAYLLNSSAAAEMVEAQSPIQAQPDWPIDSRSVVFLQESRAYVEPNRELASVADPVGARSEVPYAIQIRTWTWIWYLQHRSFFKGASDYWHGVLLPRLARHLYRSE